MNDPWLKQDLTEKQKHYVSLLASGLSTLQISQREKRSHHTIRNTIAKAKERVGAISTGNLIAIAVSQGWIEGQDSSAPYTFIANA